MKTEKIDLRTAARWLKKRPRSANKDDAGRVLLIAGSRDMPGAAALCAWGAARSGAGLVRVATVKSRQEYVARRAPLEVTSLGLPEDAAGHFSAAAIPALLHTIHSFRPTVIAFGPGVGRSPALDRLLKALLTLGLPLVLDADALNALAAMKNPPRPTGPVILTPHPGEMARLLGRRVRSDAGGRVEAATQAARRFRAVALLKGAGTVITDGKTVWRNTTGNPAMASGGMGDVLTGIIAATWAQRERRDSESGVVAAALGAFLHGLAADIAVKKEFPERTLLASDLAAFLPRAFARIRRR